LLQLAIEMKPKSYLEIGTRYNDSLLRVLAGCAPQKLDRIIISDIWHESYFGSGNNGTMFDRSHKHVERFLSAMGYVNGEVMYLDGDSAKTIPTLDKREPFDLILVDGDHNCDSPTAANSDLANAWPLVAPGGYLVFDDVGSDQKMMELYHSFFKAAPDVAASYVRIDKKFGVAVAEKESHALETSKVRALVMPYFKASLNGIDIGCSRDPLTRYCVAFDKPEFAHYPEVTHSGDAAKLPFENETFAWIWSSHCLEDFDDTEAVLSEWLRTLKLGGSIGVCVPHPDYYHGTNDEHRHPGFRIEELIGLFTKLGCNIIMTKLDNESIPGSDHYSSIVIAQKNAE